RIRQKRSKQKQELMSQQIKRKCQSRRSQEARKAKDAKARNSQLQAKHLRKKRPLTHYHPGVIGSAPALLASQARAVPRRGRSGSFASRSFLAALRAAASGRARSSPP